MSRLTDLEDRCAQLEKEIAQLKAKRIAIIREAIEPIIKNPLCKCKHSKECHLQNECFFSYNCDCMKYRPIR